MRSTDCLTCAKSRNVVGLPAREWALNGVFQSSRLAPSFVTPRNVLLTCARNALPIRFATPTLACGAPGSGGGAGGAFFNPSSCPRWRDACLAGLDGVLVSPPVAWDDEGWVAGALDEMQGSLSGMDQQGALNQVGNAFKSACPKVRPAYTGRRCDAQNEACNADGHPAKSVGNAVTGLPQKKVPVEDDRPSRSAT
jgi:hypothetical protein